MENLYKIHRNLVDRGERHVRRGLMDEINWNDRLIGIKGTRGVGKTSFLLDFVRAYYPHANKDCLYINLNTFYFSNHSLMEFVKEFREQGGKVLILDQVYKYPAWSEELSYCYEHYEDVQIIFSGSSVMRLKEENLDLDGKVVSYDLRGFSFREYLNYELKQDLPVYSFDEIVKDHETIVKSINTQLALIPGQDKASKRLLDHFDCYLHHGYYPIYTEKQNYSEHLLRTMNLMLEIDISYLKQIELKYLPKLRKLLYILAVNAPGRINISKLSKDVETSRATITNYLKYMKDARLFNLLFAPDMDADNKPKRVYMHNTNLMYVMNRNNKMDRQDLCETFFFSMLQGRKQVNSLPQKACFLLDGSLKFDVGGQKQSARKRIGDYLAQDGIEQGNKHTLPLWLLGFMY